MKNKNIEPIIFLNGIFCPKSEAKISAFDHGFLYGDGVYETLLISHNTVRDFSSHYKRLQNSCRLLGIEFPEYFDSEEKIQKILENLIRENILRGELEDKKNGRLRITLSRGENNFDFSSCPNATVLISCSSLPPYPEKIMKEGVALKTLHLERSYPEIKSINFLASLLGRREISGTAYYEGIFVTEEGFLREGTVSNIIAIDRVQKKFYLAPEKTVLAGTMQAEISEILEKLGFRKIYRNFCFTDIQHEKLELCITNSLFGVIPVRAVNEKFLDSYTENNQEFSVFQKIQLALQKQNS